MSDSLLSYYNFELDYLRKTGARFARKHTREAEQLGIDTHGAPTNDPHVERLIQAVAFLTARIQHKLDDTLPEITNGILSVLYPHFLAPVPSMSIIKFNLASDQADAVQGYMIDRHTTVVADTTQGDRCEFRTAYDTRLYPINITDASLGGRGPRHRANIGSDAVSVLSIDVQTLNNDVKFGMFDMPYLRFFIAQPQFGYSLYELICNDVVEVVLEAEGIEPVHLGSQAIRPVGFADDEGLLPYTAQSFLGYRLLTEYFAFPQKFLFIDIVGLTAERLKSFAGKMSINFYLRRTAPDLERTVDRDVFQMGCTPIVNLFEKSADTIKVDHKQHQYRIMPESKNPLAYEVFSIERVRAARDSSNDFVEYLPIYSMKHADVSQEQDTFWYAKREPARQPVNAEVEDHGTDMLLTLVDLAFDPGQPSHTNISLDLLCTNRDLPTPPDNKNPNGLESGGDYPHFALLKGGPLEQRRPISCLVKPTAPLRRSYDQADMWQAISHLSLNHLSIARPDGSADVLREILELYNYTNEHSHSHRQVLNSILSVTSHPDVARPSAASRVFTRGTRVEVTFDESAFPQNATYLFASVLERFMTLYCNLNTFTRFVAHSRQREIPIRQWHPRSAEQILL